VKRLNLVDMLLLVAAASIVAYSLRTGINNYLRFSTAVDLAFGVGLPAYMCVAVVWLAIDVLRRRPIRRASKPDAPKESDQS
jgi:hypothetical protein